MDGEVITQREGRELRLLVAEPDLAITWSRYAAGERGADLHVHREHVDAFYVVEGELTFRVGPDAERLALAAGGYVAIPPNVVHAFDNDAATTVEYLNFHAPDGGFGDYLRAARDGRKAAFDSFDPPADGGRRAADATVLETLVEAGLGRLRVGADGSPPPAARFTFGDLWVAAR
ncbi:MAG TPA: cupin domain-containing protein [Solirubrobacteraceae bacterium]